MRLEPIRFRGDSTFSNPPHVFYSRRGHRQRPPAPLPLHYVTVMARCNSYARPSQHHT
jgi:hypothetical protein